MKKLIFEVVVKNPQTDSREMAEYIREAIQSWKGCANPDDPIFYQQSEDFTVKPKKA